MNNEVIVGAIYKHFKGNLYKVLHIGYSCDDESKLVIYKSLETNKIWVRNYQEFISEVDHNKYPNITSKYRFEKQ